MPHTFAGEPCPPCAAAQLTDTYIQRGWNNFGILVWDYNMPKGHPGAAPQNLHLSGLEIRRCAMGLHVLGATNVSLMDSVLDHNGNGNAYFHNAYFLRIVGTLIKNTTLRHSTGHGLKITQQNATVIDNCTVSDNGWQGIWIGSESKGNWDLKVLDTTVERNTTNGIQLGDTDGFEVRGCVIVNNPVAAKAGIAVEGSRNGIIADSNITANNINVAAPRRRQCHAGLGLLRHRLTFHGRRVGLRVRHQRELRRRSRNDAVDELGAVDQGDGRNPRR